jgi:hypothetical protein
MGSLMSCTRLPKESGITIAITSPTLSIGSATTKKSDFNSLDVSPQLSSRGESLLPSVTDMEESRNCTSSRTSSRRGSLATVYPAPDPQLQKMIRTYVGSSYNDYLKISNVLGLECFQQSVAICKVDNFTPKLAKGQYIAFTLETPYGFDSSSFNDEVDAYIINFAKQCLITGVRTITVV